MVKYDLGLLSLGVFLIVLALWIATAILSIITVEEVVPLILLSSGLWIVVVAGIKSVRSEEGGAFTIFGWGMVFIVLGGSLLMVIRGMNPLYVGVFILLLIGVLAVVAALRSQ